MIESMVTATAHNIRALLDGKEPAEKATWNAVCLADFGDTGIAFVALPQIPPRSVNWFSEGKWVHLAKIAFEKYFLRKIKKGFVGPFYDNLTLRALGMHHLERHAFVQRCTRLGMEVLPGQFDPGLVLAVDEKEFLRIQHSQVLQAANRHEQAFSRPRQQRVCKVVGGGGKKCRQACDFLFAIETFFHGVTLAVLHPVG